VGLRSAVRERFNGPAPRRLLRVVDLSQIQNLPLNNPVSPHAPVLDEAPRAMNLAILATDLGPKKHARRLSGHPGQVNRVGRHYRPVSPSPASKPKQIRHFQAGMPVISPVFAAELLKSG
jgi:hypothetical protein